MTMSYLQIRDPDSPPTQIQISDATKVRKRLTDSFIQYESAARRIRDLPTDSPTQARLQKAVFQQASGFIHLNMLPLKALPKILKHASPHGAKSAQPSGRPSGSALARISNGNGLPGTSSPASTSSAALESLEAEEKDLRERLIVLEEQKFLVSEMLAAARKRRKFEEMTVLSGNLEDLNREIDGLRARLSRLEGDFADVYREMDTASVTG
jgi:rabenosyn-5